MGSIALVRASNPGYLGRYRAGDRHWLNGQEYSVEVVEDPTDGPALLARDPIDPATGLSDMARISKAGLLELKGDEHISVLEGDNAVTSAAAAAAVGRVRELAADLAQSKLAEQMALDEVAALTAQVADLTAKLAEAKAGKSKSGKGDKSDAAPDAPPATDAPKG